MYLGCLGWLVQHGQHVKPGDQVNYVYVDTEQVNPIKRVSPIELAETYDVDKYAGDDVRCHWVYPRGLRVLENAARIQA